MFADDIRKADQEAVVYFLLTAYIETLRAGDPPARLPEHVTRLPVRGAVDVKMRFEKLVIELDAASRQLDDRACVGIRDALHVFGTALNRVGALERAVPGNPIPGRRADTPFAAPVPGPAADERGAKNI